MLTILADKSLQYDYSESCDSTLQLIYVQQENKIRSAIQMINVTPEERSNLLTEAYSRKRAAKRELDKRGINYEVC